MRTYGRITKLKRNLPDHHVHEKGYVNWWEVEMDTTKSKKSERQKARKDILIEQRDTLQTTTQPPYP